MTLGKEPLRLDLPPSVLAEGQLCQSQRQVTWTSFEERRETWERFWFASQSKSASRRTDTPAAPTGGAGAADQGKACGPGPLGSSKPSGGPRGEGRPPPPAGLGQTCPGRHTFYQSLREARRGLCGAAGCLCPWETDSIVSSLAAPQSQAWSRQGRRLSPACSGGPPGLVDHSQHHFPVDPGAASSQQSLGSLTESWLWVPSCASPSWLWELPEVTVHQLRHPASLSQVAKSYISMPPARARPGHKSQTPRTPGPRQCRGSRWSMFSAGWGAREESPPCCPWTRQVQMPLNCIPEGPSVQSHQCSNQNNTAGNIYKQREV